MSGGCPRGSTEVSGSCVAPLIFGEAREIALTLHAPCTSCSDDGGLELAGKLWLSLAAALQVPLQETKASVLLMGRQLWRQHPLQHFTLTKTGEGPLVTNQGGRLRQSALDVGESWDLFMAVRIHTSRVASGDASLSELLVSYAGPILDVLGQSNGVEVFEIRSRKTAQLTDMNYLTARFKIHELPWGEEPPPLKSSYFPPAPPPPPPPPAPQPTTVITTKRSTTLAPTTTSLATSPTTTPGPPVSTTERCRCHLTWLGDGICDHYCNTESCKWDEGDCIPPKTLAQAPSATSAAGADSFQQATTTTSRIQILPTHGNQVSLDQKGSRRRPTQSQSPIVSLEVDETEKSGLHIVATSDGRSWSADEVPKEYAEGDNGPSPILIAAFIAALLCILPAICCLARRRKNLDIIEQDSQSQKIPHDWRDDEPFMEKRGSSKDRYSTDSGVSTESGGDSPQSWSFFTTSPLAKEPKVHPEPDPEDPRETNGGNSLGGWRLPSSTPTSGKSPAAKQQGFRPEAPKWERPSQPQPPAPSYWNDRREQERAQRQREQDERQKATERKSKEEQDAWQEQWRQNKREQDREKKIQQEELRQQQKQQEKERKEQQRQQEKERRRKEQEQEWKRQEEDLRRKHMAEKEAHERRQEEAKRQREEEERRQAQRQKEEDQRRQQSKRQKQQDKAEKGAKKKEWGSAFFSFAARSRAASEPPRSRAASEPPPNSGQGPSTSAEDRGNSHTRWAGFDGRGPGGSAATERTAQDAAEQRAREKAQQEASKKANSLLDRVMKQLDSTRSSPLEERKKVFRDLQRQLHPDKNPDDQEAAKLAFQRLMESRDSYLS